MKPIAIVIPWFGKELTGGAEQQAFQIATRLAARDHSVEVLTTCNRAFDSDWAVNHLEPGTSNEFDLTVRRFPVDTRDSKAFDRVNAKLLTIEPCSLLPGVSPVPIDDTYAFVGENIKSAVLINYLRSECESYLAFIFLPYMFQPTMLGALLVSDRAWLQPCLHNEPQAYLPQSAELFRRVHGILFNSDGERELALRINGPGIFSRSSVIGEGIERPNYESGNTITALPSSLRGSPFLLYLGRRDPTKNVDMLARAFVRFKSKHRDSPLQLVVAGPGTESFASSIGIHDLGLVSDEIRAALLVTARALVQPSRNESFSRTMMEAWAVGRPVVVHSHCQATAVAVERSGGGWMAANETEWAELFQKIAGLSAAELAEVGERGRRYSDEHANWDEVISRYESLLGLTSHNGYSKTRPIIGARSTGTGLRAIHQLLPDVVFADAISNQALAIRTHLRQHGYESEIFVKRRDERIAEIARLFDEVQPGSHDGLLYHHSIGSELTAFAIAHAGPKCLIYHNITPAEYYEPFRPGFSWMLETGRASLKRLSAHFELSVGDSAYNAAELAASGFPNPGVLPIIVTPDRWNIAPREALMKRLQDGRRNLLFVGRIAPNKKQDRLIQAFSHYRKLDPASRLILAGEGRLSDPYFHHVLETIKRLDLASAVEMTGQIEDEALLAYYRTAHLYWSFSEHEGFGAPLVEAMWFDLPVLALRTSAVAEILERAGDLFEADDRLLDVALRAYQLIHNRDLRRTIVDTQWRCRSNFTPAVVSPILTALVERLAEPIGSNV